MNAAKREHRRVIIDIRDAGMLIVLVRDLVKVTSRGQARPDIDEL
jgi:hypothetical protein